MGIENFQSRPRDMKHCVFVRKVLKKNWPELHSVRLGKRPDLNHMTIAWWCAEQPGRFYRSDGCEVYFFDNLVTAVHFKMRWSGPQSKIDSTEN